MTNDPAEDALNKRIGYILRQAQRSLFRKLIADLAPLDLRPGQFTLLYALAHNPGMTQNEAANLLAIQKTNFVAFVKDLERRGLVFRKTSPQDRRERRIYLTEAGNALAARAESIGDNLEAFYTEAVGGPAARDNLLAMLQAVIRSSEDEPEPAGSKDTE